ncbi:MAG TPA: ABC transporter permease [Thermomicrobiales bacterium]|nr:ABC transporter permease [Thermomicrobiales bacterium]
MSFLLRRLFFYLIAAWAAITINFFLPRSMPGDPATSLFAKQQGMLQPEQLESLKQAYGLTGGSLWEQYVTYLTHISRGEFGVSFTQFPVPVVDVIKQGLMWTLLLGFVTLILGFVIGTALGALCAWRRGGRLDATLPTFFMFIGSFPYFFLALLAVYVLGVQTGWFPQGYAYEFGLTQGWNQAFIRSVAWHMALPVMSVVLVSIGHWLVGMRNAMISVLSEDYLMMAEAKGLSQARILIQYAARNAILPSVTALGMGVGFIFSGLVLTEIVFAYPGLGYLLFQAVTSLDYPLMQALFLMITLGVLLANFLIDFVYVLLDPRTRGAQMQLA